MYMKSTKSLLVLVAGAMLLAGCSTRIADFTMVTTENVDMDEEYQKVGQTKGSDSAIIFGVPDQKLAVDDALENADATYLTNARLIQTAYTGFYLKLEVTGDAWAPVESAEAEGVKGKIYELKKTDNGKFLVSEDGSEKVKVDHTR
jgi:hypothetical protein